MNLKYAPECPFCGRFIKRPKNTRTEFGELIYEKCICGALYACDPTGRNLGEVFVDAMAIFAGNWDIESNASNNNYFIKELDYDLKTHRYINEKGENRSSGRLIFINKSDIKKRYEAPVKKSDGNIKKMLIGFLQSQDFNRIAEISEGNQSVISKLISLSYDKEDLIAWRAIESFYSISKKLTPIDQSFVRNTIRRLLWSMSDESGGIGWSACEILGMIISANVKEYDDIIPLLWSFREEEMFKPGVMWAIYHIALSDKERLLSICCDDLIKYVNDNNPYVRVYALRCINTIGCQLNDSVLDLESIATDEKVTYYEKGQLITSTVADLLNMYIKK